jgi:large subunit ribosomal protein L11
MVKKEIIDLLVEGGKAKPSPTVASKLSKLNVGVDEVFRQVNEKTKDFAGIQIPVKLKIDVETQQFEIEVGTPPVSSMIKKELGIEVAKITDEEKAKGKTVVGDITMQQIIKIAKAKMSDLLAKDLKTATKIVVGTCVSMPLTIEGKKSKEIIKAINEGEYDKIFEELKK